MSGKGKRASLMGDQLQEEIDLFRKLYMPMDLNSAFLKNKLNALKKIDFILNHTNRKTLQESDFETVVAGAFTLLYFFGMRLKMYKLSSKRRWCWDGKRQFLKAETVFQKTMDQMHPERSEIIVKIALNFFTDVSLWPFENFVGQILEVVLYFNNGRMTLFNIMLTDIHYVIFRDVTSARHRMRVLYDLLKSDYWIIDKHKLLPFITRLLDFFAYSITKDDNKKSVYGYLRKGLEVCLRRIFERAENRQRLKIVTTMLNWFSLVNLCDDDVLEFSTLLDRAAELYVVVSFADSFTEGLLDHILKNFVGSSNSLYSLIGCRLLQRLLDRQSNAKYLINPTIYYEFSQVGLLTSNFDSGDKSCLRQQREKMHEYFLMAVRKHCHSTNNLKALFSVICCIILEVPCGLTAAVASCIAMSIQDFALNGENLAPTSRYWMHAIVISIMSLICWVHKSPVLYGYVNQIVSRRAKEAPQLNPPLLPIYNVGHQHVTWNKPTLFFEDWELRYGLWKHFRKNVVRTYSLYFSTKFIQKYETSCQLLKTINNIYKEA